MPTLALATCTKLPDWECDDRPLHTALAERGATVQQPAWDDPDVDWGTFDACLVRTTWDYTERRAQFVAWAESVARVTRLFNPPDVIRWNTHKSYLREVEERGVRVVRTLWLTRGERVDIASLVRERGWERAFLKPQIGATARETLRFESSDAELRAAQAHADRLLVNEDLMLQPYIDAVEEEGELSFIFLDGEFSHAVQKRPVAGDYRVQDAFGGMDGAFDPAPTDLAVARSALAASGFQEERPLLYGRADFLRDTEGRLALIELELVEPSLFLRHAPAAGPALADALLARL